MQEVAPMTISTVAPVSVSELELLGAEVVRIPVLGARKVEVRFAPLTARDRFNPHSWQRKELAPDPAASGYYQIDLNYLQLPDGAYEYEFVVDDRADSPVADPYAEELTRFGGYRGIFRIMNSRRLRQPFSWDDELPEGRILPSNNKLAIYEMPLRWMAAAPESSRQIGLGDFDHIIFELLDELAELGINAIELLPVQDSPDTLNWGYGTRFFFAPDFDMGTPVDMKFFIKCCHQRGIRTILDVVMNHAQNCPLEMLADDWFFLKSGDEEGGRPDWGGRIFRYRRPAPDGSYPAREFHYRMAEFWVSEYHIDGFRIDEFKGIDHWEFIQTFRNRAWAAHQQLFPNRPFLVIAEDSWRRAAAVHDRPTNPNGRKVVDAIWNFAFRDESRRLFRNQLHTVWGQPSRRERIQAMIAGWQMWDDWDHSFKEGFSDMAQSVNYITSHDVEKEGEQRLMNYIFGDLLRRRQLGSGSVDNIRWLSDNLAAADPRVGEAHEESLDRVRSALALLMTGVGIPMFLAGEEFGDVHDLDPSDWRLKMSDPVDWRRRQQPGHRALWDGVREFIRLRTSFGALQRNEVDFFYFHPTLDDNDGVRVFAYCRTGGKPLGSPDQVVVVANCGAHDFPAFDFPWPWTDAGRIQECGVPLRGSRPQFRSDRRQATISLAPFQVRVFCV
jgi:1,4-alpha-glucan branching enzyme